jgi:hypothetical protein
MRKPGNSMLQWNYRGKFRRKRPYAGGDLSDPLVAAPTSNDKLPVLERKIVIIIGHLIGYFQAISNPDVRQRSGKLKA